MGIDNLDDIGLQITQGVYPSLKERAEEIGNNTYISRKAVAASVCLTEHERETVLDSEDIKYELLNEGSTFIFREKEKQEIPLAVQLVDEGKPAPVTLGPDGTATDITGETYPAESHYEGFVLEDYAWPATHFRDETNTILNDIIPAELQDGVTEYAQSNTDIFASYITESIQQHLGGGS